MTDVDIAQFERIPCPDGKPGCLVLHRRRQQAQKGPEMDIAEFLTACLDEDERWAENKHDSIDCDLGALQTFGECSCGYPARVLADIAAKRAIVKEHTAIGDGSGLRTICHTCSYPDDWERTSEGYPCATLRHLAAPYADHADYDPAWRIDG